MIQRTSVWWDDIKPLTFKPTLSEDIQTDVVVVGAGITGITAAYLLSRMGKRVVVLEKNSVGGGETGFTTAFLTYAADEDLSQLKKTFGEKAAIEVWKSLRSAIEQIETNIITEKIDCEYSRCPLYFFAAGKEGAYILKEEHAIAKKGGFPVLWSKGVPGLAVSGRSLLIKNNAKFHPLKYLLSLANKVAESGGEIYEHTEVVSYSHVPEPTVTTAKAVIRAKHIVVATHNPNNLAVEVHTRISPMQTYVIAGTLPAGKVPEGLYINTLDPYHYLRIDAGEKQDRFILGGEDNETGRSGSTANNYKKLEKYLKTILPNTRYTITHEWSGQVIETVDGLPFIGEYVFAPSHMLAGTGYAGDGMTFGTLAAQIVVDAILGKRNPWAQLYSTKRLKGVKEMLKQNYTFIKELIVGRTEVAEEDIKNIPKNSGKVIKVKNTNLAVYKNSTGSVIKLSPVCTHLGCIVDWNREAKTWDCPCHGSRYNKDGSVLNGPAKKPLKRID